MMGCSVFSPVRLLTEEMILLTEIFKVLIGLRVIFLNLLVSDSMASSLVLYSIRSRITKVLDLSARWMMILGLVLRNFVADKRCFGIMVPWLNSRCLTDSAESRCFRLLWTITSFLSCKFSRLLYSSSSSTFFWVGLNLVL